MVIILEGISGAGKTTQVARLKQQLHGAAQLATVEEFSRGPVGRMIAKSYEGRRERFVRLHSANEFADQSYLVLLADTVAKAEEASCLRADVLLIDRLFDSWLCYTQASTDRRALEAELVASLYRLCVRAHVPADAVTVYLDVDVETAVARLARRDGFGSSREDRLRLEAIAGSFQELYMRTPVVRVAASQEPKRVTADIMEALGLGRSSQDWTS